MKTAVKLTDEDVAHIRFEARVEYARRCAERGDVLGWAAACFPQKFYLKFCEELHGYFVQIRKEKFTNTEAPRGRAKTTVKCLAIPAYQALNEPTEFRHYLNVQATEDKALSVNRALKMEFEENPVLAELYGHMIGERWTDGEFVLSNGVIFNALGAGQSIRGVNYRNVRPDYIIIDDLYDENDINNTDSTEKKNDWFWSSLYPARSQSTKASVHLQGTAINKRDLMFVLKTNPQVRSKSFKAVKNFETKEVLWPELKSFAEVMLEKELFLRTGMKSTVIWEREYQNERRDDATSIIKEHYLASWEYDPVDLYKALRLAARVHCVGVWVGNDPSIGKTQNSEGKKLKSDFTGTALVIETRETGSEGSEFWIEGLWNERLSLVERKTQLQKIAESRPTDFPLTKVRIEAISGFDDYASEVVRTTNLPVQRISWVKDKISTLESKSSFFENHRVHLNKNIPQDTKQLIFDQLTSNYPPHDDLRDAVLLTMEPRKTSWEGYAP